MRNIYILLFFVILGFTSRSENGLTDCEKVQTLLTIIEEFRGPKINDSAYECKSDFILDGFKAAKVTGPGNDAKYWTVNMNTEPMTQVEAEAKYLTLIQDLMRCSYLNSWKAGETTIEENLYHFTLKQTISNTGHYKSILVSYYKLSNAELYKVEIIFNY